MTSRRWPFVSSDCRIDPATITHKESIHWIHTTEGCDEGGDTIGRQLGRKRQPLNSLTRERFSRRSTPATRSTSSMSLDRSSDVLLYDISFSDFTDIDAPPDSASPQVRVRKFFQSSILNRQAIVSNAFAR